MNIDDQVALLMQGTEYGDDEIKESMREELKQRLNQAEKENRPLRIYCGYDPTKADLHLGHTVTMRKLRQFQELGHHVIFLIGDFTALIGDPSDKDVTRPILTREQVEKNAHTYAEQAFRILDPQKTEIRYNSEWLSKLGFADLIKVASNFTVQQFLSREKFKLRWEKGDPIYIHETFYAFMQGFDAYSLDTDVQIGGTDQFFNIMMAGRKIMSALGKQPNIVITLPILPGTDGEIKMSKSLGNDIPITTNADDMYGKLMSIPDKAMPQYFRLVTRWTPDRVDALEKELAAGKVHPRDAKMSLAYEVTDTFYGKEQADKAQQDFILKFQKKEIPDDIPSFIITADQTLLDVMMAAKLAPSKSQGKRLFEQGGVSLDGETIADWGTFARPGVLQVGKRKFLELKL
ncbi:MAG TPA: tyrosine--tRNA ligase [Anaerolineaceae bacterium]|uniref:Tyrosine--tRNA ligase n=1 Tax=Anaerolinea thermophila TaxID=167964 RepID=A0A101FXS5_9CHLR|nr:MAG: tyrS [Anaerolinea thermophila]HAF63003.1 tyrosine--tRNA ligase [Anaerolineaceae bacterium]